MPGMNFESVYREIFPFWEKIGDADREYICQNSYAVTYPKGKNIHDGSECSGVILVRSGSLRLYMMSDEGKDITLYRLHKGDLCMLSASCVLDAVTFDVFVDAEEESGCCVVSGSAFAAVSERNPDIRIFALETAVSRFSDVMWVMQQILFMSMDKRLAIFLSDESARTGKDTIELTHGQIAKYMGSAREVVSRMLKYFAAEGIVEVSPYDELSSGEIVSETVQIPSILSDTGKFNTVNLQEELAKSMADACRQFTSSIQNAAQSFQVLDASLSSKMGIKKRK